MKWDYQISLGGELLVKQSEAERKVAEAKAEAQKARDDLSRIRYPDSTGQ